MPPAALKALSFSGKGETVNEAVTVGIRLDPETGRVASSRVMLTALPPVVPLTFDQTDRCRLSSCRYLWCYLSCLVFPLPLMLVLVVGACWSCCAEGKSERLGAPSTLPAEARRRRWT